MIFNYHLKKTIYWSHWESSEYIPDNHKHAENAPNPPPKKAVFLCADSTTGTQRGDPT